MIQAALKIQEGHNSAADPSERRAKLEAQIHKATRRVAPLWSLKYFVAVNPFFGLPGLRAAELGVSAVGRLEAPNPLRRREHRIAAIAFLVVAVVLIAVNDHLVPDLPAMNLSADGPYHARRIGARNVVADIVEIEDRHRLAERRPYSVVIDAGRAISALFRPFRAAYEGAWAQVSPVGMELGGSAFSTRLRAPRPTLVLDSGCSRRSK